MVSRLESTVQRLERSGAEADRHTNLPPPGTGRQARPGPNPEPPPAA
jgi:hypothetical protein